MSLADIPPRYPFQALPPHYGRPYPFLLQPTAASDADGLAPDVPLPADGPERLALSPEDKPIRLSPSKIPEPLREGPDEEPLAEREVKAEVEDMDEGPAELPSLESPLTLPPEEALAAPSPTAGCGGGLLEAQALSASGQGGVEPPGCPDFADKAEARVDSPGRTESCTAAPDLGARLTPETLVEAKEEPVEVPVDRPMAVPLVEAVPEEGLAQAAPSEPRPSLELADCGVPAGEGECLSLEAREAAPVPSGTCFLEDEGSDWFVPGLEDPLAGMNALAAAAELPQARPLPSPGPGAQALEKLEAAQSLVLGQSVLHGITLLSEIAELELEKRSQDVGGEPRWVVAFYGISCVFNFCKNLNILKIPRIWFIRVHFFKKLRQNTRNEIYHFNWLQVSSVPSPFLLPLCRSLGFLVVTFLLVLSVLGFLMALFFGLWWTETLL